MLPGSETGIAGASPGRPRWTPLLTAALLFLGYLAAGKLGLAFARENPSASSVWPPTGIALAATLLWGRWALPAVFLGALVVNATTAGTPLPTAALIALGNTLEAAVGAFLIGRFAGGRSAPLDPQTVFSFAALAAVASAVSATIGVAALEAAGRIQPAPAGAVWLTWWLGDCAGALLFAPLILLWARPMPNGDPGPRRVAEVLAFVAAAAVVPGLAFSGLAPGGLAYAGASLLAWSAFRLGQRATAAATVAWAAIAVAGTVAGHGPFVGGSPGESLLLLQTYMAVLALTTLAMSAAVKQRRALAARLESEVESRTRDLASANARLVREAEERAAMEHERQRRIEAQAARHEAERMNRRKDEFLATVSHELRTPLSAVLGWAELLQRPGLGEAERAAALETILRNARLQTRLISDMLDVSRIITTGRLDLKLQPSDPAAAVERALAQLGPAAEAKMIALRFERSGDSRAIVADPDRLVQAVANVVGNAIKFTPAGGEVHVSFRQEEGVEITVTDTGPGIDPEFLPRLFDRFSQPDASSTRRHGGLGLGLSIARHILELHGGRIEASNRPEGGARFDIRIPFTAEAAMAQLEPAEGGSASEPILDRQPLRGVKVLIVDDDAGSREIAAAAVGRCGGETRAAASVSEALAALAREAADLMVVDLAMPGEDGYGFLRKARASFPRVPALALTAHATAFEEARARRAGFDAFLGKPVELHRLIGTLAELAASGGTASAP